MSRKYIVVGKTGPLVLDRSENPKGRKGGVLLVGNTATVFNSWSTAQAAIDRTDEYTKQHNLHWDVHWMRPMSLDFQFKK